MLQGSRHKGKCLCPPCFNDDPDEVIEAIIRARVIAEAERALRPGRAMPTDNPVSFFCDAFWNCGEVVDSTQPCAELHCTAYAVALRQLLVMVLWGSFGAMRVMRAGPFLPSMCYPDQPYVHFSTTCTSRPTDVSDGALERRVVPRAGNAQA